MTRVAELKKKHNKAELVEMALGLGMLPDNATNPETTKEMLAKFIAVAEKEQELPTTDDADNTDTTEMGKEQELSTDNEQPETKQDNVITSSLLKTLNKVKMISVQYGVVTVTIKKIGDSYLLIYPAGKLTLSTEEELKEHFNNK
jgi:hypothetical protein